MLQMVSIGIRARSADMVARANKARGENRWKIYDLIAKQFELAVKRGLKKMAARIQQAA
jgi:hypothetical protein